MNSHIVGVRTASAAILACFMCKPITSPSRPLPILPNPEVYVLRGGRSNLLGKGGLKKHCILLREEMNNLFLSFLNIVQTAPIVKCSNFIFRKKMKMYDNFLITTTRKGQHVNSKRDSSPGFIPIAYLINLVSIRFLTVVCNVWETIIDNQEDQKILNHSETTMVFPSFTQA